MTAFALQETGQEARRNGTNSDGGLAAAGRTAAAASAPPAAAAVAWPSRDACLYTRCYCEENVWKLAHTLVHQLPPPWRLFAVFLSNPNQTVPLWRQRSAAAPSQPVLWDYHVILLAQLADQALVLDLDSTLPFPCSLREYRQAALLGDDSSLAPQYRRCYRVVPVRLFLRHFASDRSHMVGRGGEWLAPPPPWPCLVADSGASNTLPAYLDFSEIGGAGAGGSEHAAEAAGSGGPEASTAEQRAQWQQQQQQPGQHAGGCQQHSSVAQDGNAALPSEEGPPLGSVLREPAFLRLFGLDRPTGMDL